MIGVETAIRRLAFTEARQSSAEATVMIAAHREELEQATAIRGATEDQQAANFADRQHAQRHIDKKV